MQENTTRLLEALNAANEQIPAVAHQIVSEEISPDDQAEFGDLLIRLGELVKLHAWEVRGHS